MGNPQLLLQLLQLKEKIKARTEELRNSDGNYMKRSLTDLNNEAAK
jgi:hypothetical protein